MNNINIAVIIPIYNAEDYIAECLDSLIAQSYPNWTAYCVNDGSKDSSAKILDSYSQKDSRIKVFHKTNGGASSARNCALNHLGNEEWISFVDADDFVSPHFYSAIINAINDNPNIQYVRLRCTHTDKRYCDYVTNGWPEENFNHFEGRVLVRNNYFLQGEIGGYISSLFIKSSVVRNQQLQFAEDMRLMEDQLFSILCALNSTYILDLQNPKNYFYYAGNTQSITKSAKDSRSDIIKCINRVFERLEQGNEAFLIKQFFYKKWFPEKMESFYSNSIIIKKKYNGVHILNKINFSFSILNTKLFVKMIIAKLYSWA